MYDDDADYPPEGGCLGIGGAHAISERGMKKAKKEPIGFVHFPDRPELKSKRVKRSKPKLKSRRKR